MTSLYSVICSEPQMDAVPFEPKMTQIVQEASRSLWHPNVIGMIIPTSPELEPGMDEQLAEVIGGVCLQVGCVELPIESPFFIFIFE